MEFYDFPYIRSNHPNRVSYFSEGWLNHQADMNCEVDDLCGCFVKLFPSYKPCYPSLRIM
jgi:hypothetical protein